MVKTIGISDLRKDISAKVKEVHEQRIRYIIIQRSKPKAVLLSLEELESLEGVAEEKAPQKSEREEEDAQTGLEISYEDFFYKKLEDRLK